MSHLLWKSFWENDVDRFRHLLAPAGNNPGLHQSQRGVGSTGTYYTLSGSPGSFGSSPKATAKSRKASSGFVTSKTSAASIGKAEVNSRDHAGLTLLLRAASSTTPSAVSFVEALLSHPSIDIYALDPESGWNALHRALYNGNITIARILLEKEHRDITNLALGGIAQLDRLIKIKDHEGNSPFDLYNSTTGHRVPQGADSSRRHSVDDSDSEESDGSSSYSSLSPHLQSSASGEEMFVFGSNKNLSLGVGDQDDRQYPERITLKRPDHLLLRFNLGSDPNSTLSRVEDIPNLIRNQQIFIDNVVMSKLHTAVLTTDVMSNLYICGIGTGGRLGLGDTNTQFRFVPVQGPLMHKQVTAVALGQNHTLAVTGKGELWSWGSNAHSQLGYVLPPAAEKGEEAINPSPRQVFAALKKEFITGVAASAIHSVAHSSSSLYSWGKNVGQLGVMDADSRSLVTQSTPRRVAASLFSCSISMVSAIERATSVLLSNHTVCVFTSYGYNFVQFPFGDIINSASLNNISMSSRYDHRRHQIKYITSGGETIGAVTGRGDLFTMNLNRSAESNPQTSTTNPSKIKNALTPPKCIWVAKKDGVRSVDVGEHGSVIICTQSGAVWRRVKRQTNKTGWASGQSTRRNDFKFQRVPYITNVVTVRSSTFGAFAAVRKDNDSVWSDIPIAAMNLWADIGGLCHLNGFKSSAPDVADNDGIELKEKEIGEFGPLACEILKSADAELDLSYHLSLSHPSDPNLNVQMCTSTRPDLCIPIHGWILAARSTVLREAFSHFRQRGAYTGQADAFTLEEKGRNILITFSGLDVLTILNLVVYVYNDKTVPVWNFLRQKPHLAYRFRQIRSEVMKTAMRLGLRSLEGSARLQTPTNMRMHIDFLWAMQDRSWFQDADVIMELQNDKTALGHSSLLCRRCPWFQGLFHGRSEGAWLQNEGRRDSSGRIRIDFKHMSTQAFDFVLGYLYTDGGHIFNMLAAANIDEWGEVVFEVLECANYLMLDRLSEICQDAIGKFVTTRNISPLLNKISHFIVPGFKDAGLEYICLQMECMLENNLLDVLGDDLMQELDSRVRDNQASYLPFGKSNSAEVDLYSRYPELAGDITEERQRRVKEMAFKATLRDEERKVSSSFKGRYGSFDDVVSTSPTAERERCKSRSTRNEPFSPVLRPKLSSQDMMFDMDEDSPSLAEPSSLRNRTPEAGKRVGSLDHVPCMLDSTPEFKGKVAVFPGSSPLAYRTRDVSTAQGSAGNPWGPSSGQNLKLGLKEIMSEAGVGPSALSEGLSAQKKTEPSPIPSAQPTPPPKMSQKERKRQQQLQLEKAAEAEAASVERGSDSTWETVSAKSSSPWKVAPTGPRTNLKEMLRDSPKPPLAATESSATKGSLRRTASPDTRFAGQSRRPAAPAPSQPTSSTPGSRPRPSPSSLLASPPMASGSSSTARAPMAMTSSSHSRGKAKAEPALSLGLADIQQQQEREQELIREAVAKRSLQEIQQEQEFQEWWDQESRKVQEDEAKRAVREQEKEERERNKTSGICGGRGKGRGRRKGRGGGKGGREAGSAGGDGGGGNVASGSSTGGQVGGGGGPRGRGRAREGGKATASS